MTSMNVPDPVMSLAILPKTREAAGNFSKALSRFQREDPTFKVLPTYELSGRHMLLMSCGNLRRLCAQGLCGALCRSAQILTLARRSSVGWANSTWTSMWSA